MKRTSTPAFLGALIAGLVVGGGVGFGLARTVFTETQQPVARGSERTRDTAPSRPAPEATGNPESLEVLVPKLDLRPGTVIEKVEDMFESKKLPAEAVPPGAVLAANLGELRGKIVRQAMYRGEVVRDRDFKLPPPGPLDGEEMLRSTPPGYRVVTLDCALPEVSREMVRGGVRVDLIAEIADDSKAKGRPQKLFLQNVLVLGADTSKARGALVPVVVALKPEDAERAARAAKQSPLQVAVRRPDDAEIIAPREPETPTDPILVAKVDIAKGTKIKDPGAFFAVKQCPRDLLPRTAIDGSELEKLLEDLKGGEVVLPLEAGEMVLFKALKTARPLPVLPIRNPEEK